MLFVTSARYGSPQLKVLQESFAQHNDGKHSLLTFYNAVPPEGRYSQPDLDLDPSVRAVNIASASARATITDLNNYRWQCAKFYYKIAALANALRAVTTNLDDMRLIWLDADTEILKPFDAEFFRQMFPSPHICFSYLGRKDWHHLEAGIMGFDFGWDKTHNFFNAINEIYLSNQVFALQEWHDSYVIDHVRKIHEEKFGLVTHNLSPAVSGLHVWPKTFLGDYLLHHKGPQRKAERYGVTQ